MHRAPAKAPIKLAFFRLFPYLFRMIIDIVVGVVTLLSALISFLRGFIREVLTIAGVVGGLVAAYFLGPSLAPIFKSWLGAGPDDEPRKLFDIVPMGVVGDVAAYGAVFVIVVIILSVVSHFTAGAAKAMGLGPIDRTLGVIFGIARAIVLLGLLYLPFHLLMDQETKDGVFEGSRTHYIIEKTAEFMVQFLPESQQVEETAQDKIKEKLKEQDILKSDDKKAEEPVKDETPAATPVKPKPGTEGYEDGQREKLDQLFEQKPALNE